MKFEIKRFSNENIKEFWIRLCENKDTYNLNWQDIADIMNKETGDNRSESKYRKKWYAFKDGMEYAIKKRLDGEDLLEKLERKKIELKKERVKLSTLRNDLNRKISEDSRKELIYEELRRSVKQVETVEFKPLYKQDGDKSYLLTLSDIHFGKEVNSINNKYNVDIVKERFNVLLGELIKYIRKNEVGHLEILNCNDSIAGLIRISDLKANQIGLMDSVVQYARMIVDFLNELSKYVKITYREVPSANHNQCRLFSKKNEVQEDFSTIIINYIDDLLRYNDRVNIVNITGQDYLIFELQGYKIYTSHGHNFKSIKDLPQKLSMLHRTFFDTIILGHFHKSLVDTFAESIDGNVEVLITPSFIGSDNYSDKLMLGSKAAAKLHVYENGKGRNEEKTFILN